MKKLLIIGGAAVVFLIIVAAIVPMWMLTAHVQLSGYAVGLVVFMVIGCFGVGGGLMFLIFYSAHKGYDDAVGGEWQNPEKRRKVVITATGAPAPGEPSASS